MAFDVSEMDLYQAAKYYTEQGIIVHPLCRGDDKSRKCKSPGKQPILNEWQKMDKPLHDIRLEHYFLDNKYNIGAVCGKVSNLTILDIDWKVKGLWDDIFQGVDRTCWITQHRKSGKEHVLFQYTNKIKHENKQVLGFDLLTDRSNIVLSPSVHKEGQRYKMQGDIADRPEMPDIVAERINEKNALFNDLSKSLGRCRHVFRALWKAVFADKKHELYHDTTIFRSADGRKRTLALFAELKRAEATDKEMRLACQLIFGDQFDEARTCAEIKQIKAEATATNETIMADTILVQFYDPFVSKGEVERLSKLIKATKETKDESKNSETDLDEFSIPEEEKEAAKLKAINILKNDDPIKYILDTIKDHHVGDEKTEECICVSIAGQSCLNTDGIQVAVNGESGSGKSHGIKVHLLLVPAKYKEVTSLSPKAAYYMGLKPGTIIFSDDTAPTEDMEEVIKRATTNYQEQTKHTIVKDGKRQIFIIPPRINWYLTSVDSEVSEQLLNRQLTFNTSNNVDHKKAVFAKQQEKAEKGEMPVIDVTEPVLVCRRIYDNIKSQTFKVKIPYAKRIDIDDKTNSRIFPMFLDMIKGYTIFFHMQRDKDEDGYLLATEEDFYKAKALFESQTEGIVSKLNDKERAVLRVIKGYRNGCTIQIIAEKTGYSYGTVRNILKGRQKSKTAGEGLLGKVKELSISYETHTTTEEENYKISKKAEVFKLSDKFNGWDLYKAGFITLEPEHD